MSSEYNSDPDSPEVRYSPEIQEIDVPEKNVLDDYDKLLFFAGNLTSPSKIEGNIVRSISLRSERAEMFHEIMQTSRDAKKAISQASDEDQIQEIKDAERRHRKEIVSKARDKDELYKKSLQQKEVHVDLGEFGKVSSRIMDISPLENKEVDPELQRPVVIIPGISNDNICLSAVAREIALRGRRCIVIGYPESFMGSVDEYFTQSVENSENYEPHVAFNKAIIMDLLPEGDFDLMGFSNGGAIATEFLNDDEMSERVVNAVLVAPAGVSDQNKSSLIAGIGSELNTIRKDFSKLPRAVFVVDVKDKDHSPSDLPQKLDKDIVKTAWNGGELDLQELKVKYWLSESQIDSAKRKFEIEKMKKLKRRVFESHLSKVLTDKNKWRTARVKDGGSIVVVAPDSDNITKCYKVFDENSEGALGEQNDQLRVINMRGGHATPLMKPEEMIEKLNTKIKF